LKILLLFSPFKIIEEGLISLLMLIDAKIYGLFSELYSLYLELAMARIFDVTSFDSVIKNVYVLFGVVALFIVAFSLLQAMINPDDAAKGTKTVKDILKRLILCVGATCLVPFAFDFLYDFQYSILSYQVIPKTMIGVSSNANVEVDGSYTTSSGETGELKVDATVSDFAKAGLQAYGNQMAFYVLNGFLYANDTNGDGTPDDVIVEADDYFGTETGIGFGVAGCALGVIVTGVLAITGVGIPAAATTAAGTAAICAGGVVAGVVVNGVLVELNASEFSWNYVSQYMIQYYGEFDWITPFSQAVVEGSMSYTPIISTIAGVILLYMLFSFCLDLGIRAAKLVFYQIIAPISFLLSILPKNKDLMANWFKLVISTWLEVFVRIICVCGAALLISNLNFTELSSFGLIGRAVIVLGVVAFAKQAPKLFSEVTGIKSGNLKLGIKEKLAEGGAFAAGAVIGGGATAFTRNLTNRWANKDNWKNKDGKYTAGSILKNFGGGLMSASAGTVSAQFRSGKAGLNAKSFKDMKGAAASGANAAVNARDKRAAYKASHGGSFVHHYETDAEGKTHIVGGAAWGHVTDTVKGVGEWAGIGTGDATFSYYTNAAQQSNSFNDLSESTYKKKQEYMDQNSIVKALEASTMPYKNYTDRIENLKRERLSADAARAAEIDRDISDLIEKRNALNLDTEWNKYTTEKETLQTMQKTMAAKKADVISIAATQLSANQRANYSQDKEFVEAYRKAIFSGFKVSEAEYNNSKVEQVEITLSDGTKAKRDQRIFIDANGNEIGRMTLDETSILDAMLSGGEVKDEWITKENVIKIQDAIDQANIGRQHIKTQKEREHIMRNASRTAEKKDK